MKVLLVDDDDLLLDLYVAKFTESGHTTDRAADVKQAIEKIKKNEYDIVLLDLIMPGATGLELLDQVTKENLKKNTKFVILSNQSAMDYQTPGQSIEADDYIIKAESIPSEVVKKAEAIIKK